MNLRMFGALALVVALSSSSYARVEITQDTTCHVDTLNGDSANDGLTWETAKANGQQCMDLIAYKWDLAGGNARILYKDGQVDTYGIIYRGIVGVGEIHIESETCGGRAEISVHGNEARAMQGNLHEMAAISTWGSTNGAIRLRNIKLSNTGWGFGLIGNGPGWVEHGDGAAGGDSCVDYGQAASSQIASAAPGSVIFNRADYKITGSSPYHIILGNGGYFMNDGMPHTVNITGLPNFSGAFIAGWTLGNASLLQLSYSGLATGQKWVSGMNSAIYTGGGCAVLPGSIAGTPYYGGQCQ